MSSLFKLSSPISTNETALTTIRNNVNSIAFARCVFKLSITKNFAYHVSVYLAASSLSAVSFFPFFSVLTLLLTTSPVSAVPAFPSDLFSLLSRTCISEIITPS